MKRFRQFSLIGMTLLYSLFITVSLIVNFNPGIRIGQHFWSFFLQMIKLLPCVFILIGLFEVWIKKETVEKHLGHGAGYLSYIWGILLAGTTVGGLYVALPVAHALYIKGARLGVVFAYISAAAICRVPMTLFEAGILGWKFSLIRFSVSLPLVVISSILLGNYFEKNGYRMPGN